MDILIVINNYSIDAAAAFCTVSLTVMWMLSKKYPAAGDMELTDSFVRAYAGLARIASYSFCWLFISGIPRVIFFAEHESSGGRDLQAAAMVVKYCGMVVLAGVGLFFWARLSRKVGHLK